jgi:hypothetical protein
MALGKLLAPLGPVGGVERAIQFGDDLFADLLCVGFDLFGGRRLGGEPVGQIDHDRVCSGLFLLLGRTSRTFRWPLGWRLAGVIPSVVDLVAALGETDF